MSRRGKLPKVFCDRSLGRIRVPALLRAAGIDLVTLSEHYGIPKDETISDEEWLALTGKHGWLVFMKDARIRYNMTERKALTDHRVRAFCLSNQNLTAEAMARRFTDNLEAITEAAKEPGPFIYSVHVNRIERLMLLTD